MGRESGSQLNSSANITLECHPQGKENYLSTIEIIFWLSIIVYLVFSLGLDIFLIYYEDKVKWIKRRLELLEALIKDYDKLVKKRNEVVSRVRSFWDSEDLSGIHLQLSEAENEWVESTREVVKEARGCVAKYYRQKPGSYLGPFTAILRAMPIVVVLHQIDAVRSKLLDHFNERKEKAKDIYKSMEISRSKTRSLLDQFAIEEEDKSVAEVADKSVAAQNQKQKKPSTSFEDLMKKGMDLFSSMEERWSIYLLLPLHAFVKELSQLHLESETEKLWKKEAEQIIEDAEICISNYLCWVPAFSILKKLKNDIPFVTHQFREGMRLIVREFDKLLRRKDEDSLTFIDRAAEKSTFPSITDDREITSAIKSIHRKLNNLDRSSPQVADEMNSLYDELDETHKQLQKAEETAGKNACMEQLKSIAQEVDNFFERYMDKPELKRHEIREAIGLLQKITRICTIERQELTKVVGLKNEVRDLVSKLTTSSDNNPSILSIVGIKGVGKTTLAKAVFYNKSVVKHFPIRVWVTLTEGAAKKERVLLMKKDGTKDQTLDVTQVCDHLKEKLCLVVLDNVSKIVDFAKLRTKLSRSGWTNGSRIVQTTRFKKVALHADSSSTPHHIRLLTKEESWALFQKVAGIENPKKKLEPKMEKYAKKVVGKCGGLPLAILSLGCFMSAKGISQGSLSSVLKQINHGHYKSRWLRDWENNHEELSKTVRDCLYYFTHFPVDYEIPARRLVNLWVAEGLVQQNSQKTPEDTAESYLEELRDHNMIQVVALKSNAKIKTCCLPSMFREIILQDSNSTNRSQYLGTHLDRRFAYHFDDHGLAANSAEVFSKKGVPLSVLFFDKREGSKPGEHVGKILSAGIASEQYIEIKVLDLERIFRPHLPGTLSKLSNLKYLSLRWTYLEEFPVCICKLVELETLDLKHTCIRVIPSSIWKLKKLKKLYLAQKYRSRLNGKPGGNFQENLHTLWGVFLYGSYPLLGYLHKLKNLQKLKLAFQLKGPVQETLAKEVVKLEQLHSLRLRSVDEIGDPKKLILKNMSKLAKLSSLQLFGKIKDKLSMSRLPQNLTDLTLSASKLSDDPMPELQNLPKLKSLCFYADSYAGKKMVCASGSFQQLQVLRFWNLRNLEEWDVKEGALSSLIEFEARSCGNLACPTGLKYLKTLQMIKLRKMSRSFVKEAFLHRKKALLDDIEIDHD